MKRRRVNMWLSFYAVKWWTKTLRVSESRLLLVRDRPRLLLFIKVVDPLVVLLISWQRLCQRNDTALKSLLFVWVNETKLGRFSFPVRERRSCTAKTQCHKHVENHVSLSLFLAGTLKPALNWRYNNVKVVLISCLRCFGSTLSSFDKLARRLPKKALGFLSPRNLSVADVRPVVQRLARLRLSSSRTPPPRCVSQWYWISIKLFIDVTSVERLGNSELEVAGLPVARQTYGA